MHKNPLVTVLMPVYNAERFLSEAIESILTQTYKDFELLIINDGSTDCSEQIIKKYHSKDSRIRYVKNETNLKLIETLNKGIAIAIGKYIVRMDADDISKPFRIEKQVEFMESNPDIGVCGSYFTVFGEGINKPYIVKRPIGEQTIKASLLFTNAIGHPNVIIRRSVMINNNILYDKRFYRIEDWGLWTTLMPHCNFANLPYSVLDYRRTSTQETAQTSKDPLSRTYRKLLLEENLRLNGIQVSGTQIESLLLLLQGEDKNMTINALDVSVDVLKKYSQLGLAYKDVVERYVWTKAKHNIKLGFVVVRKMGLSSIKNIVC